MPKTVTVKKNYQTQKQSLDKQKFLLRFVAFEGLLNFYDGKFEESKTLMNDNFFKRLEAKQKEINQQSISSKYYGAFPQEEVLVDCQECGGPNKYPVCLYDFTTKIFDHDHLVFSTRHLIPENAETNEMKEEKKEQTTGGLTQSVQLSRSLNPNFIDWKYCQNRCRDSDPDVFNNTIENNLNKSQKYEEIDRSNVMNKSSKGDLGRRTEFSSESTEEISTRNSRQASERNGLPKGKLQMDDSKLLEPEESKEPGQQPQDVPERKPEQPLQKLQLVRNDEIDPVVPIYRGVHICEKLFVHIFRTEFKKDATEIGGEANKGPLFANPYLLPQECVHEDEKRYQGIHSLPRSYQLLKMFYTHIIHEQLPQQERMSMNAQGAGKGNPLRSVIKDYKLSEFSYYSKKRQLYDKSKEAKGGILGGRNAQIREN